MIIVIPINEPSVSLVSVFLTLPQERKFQSFKIFVIAIKEDTPAEPSGIRA
jgi:hypothetical protein